MTAILERENGGADTAQCTRAGLGVCRLAHARFGFGASDLPVGADDAVGAIQHRAANSRVRAVMAAPRISLDLIRKLPKHSCQGVFQQLHPRQSLPSAHRFDRSQSVRTGFADEQNHIAARAKND